MSEYIVEKVANIATSAPGLNGENVRTLPKTVRLRHQ